MQTISEAILISWLSHETSIRKDDFITRSLFTFFFENNETNLMSSVRTAFDQDYNKNPAIEKTL